MRFLGFLMCLLLLWHGAVFATENNVEIKQNAPSVYVVKKGDTLWQIAGQYLVQPWNWPLLWQKNEHISNPHLIYPGDRIILVNNPDGTKSVTIERTAKRQIKLTPKAQKQLKNPSPIPTISWALIETHVRHDLIMEPLTYEAQPYLLGDQAGAVRFAQTDVVLGQKRGFTSDKLHIVRRHSELFSSDGESLGLLVKHVADAKPVPSDLETELLVYVTRSDSEVKRGDRLLPIGEYVAPEILELEAATSQAGHIISSLQDRALMGKYDTVVLDIGLSNVKRGTVMGIYLRGPDIITTEPPTYASETTFLDSPFSDSDRIAQPALKVGELVIFKVFDKVSYGLITSSTNVIRTGAIVAKP